LQKNIRLADCISNVISKIPIIDSMTQKSQKQQIGIAAAIVVLAIGVVTVGSSYATGSLWDIQSAEISIDEAAAIAITHLNTDSSNLEEVGMEKEGESFTYEVEFEIDGQEVSVEIDPHTGEILEVESEPLEIEDELDEDGE